MLLPFIPTVFRRRAGQVPRSKRTAAPGEPLTLVTGSYDSDALTLDIQFDRAVNIGGINLSQITLDDGIYNHQQYVPNTVTQTGPDSLHFTVYPTGPTSAGIVDLLATALSGIVAVDDGGTWPGTDGLELPWP